MNSSSKELMVGEKPLSSLRVVDLKEELEKRGLSKSGSKKDLADRLKNVSATWHNNVTSLSDMNMNALDTTNFVVRVFVIVGNI